MITINDMHGRPHHCYADKTPPERPPIAWLLVSPELKHFYREMASKGVREFYRQLDQINT